MKKLFAVIFSLFMFAFIAHGQLGSGDFDEINGSLPSYHESTLFGTTTYSSSVSYGLYGSITGTGVYQSAQNRTYYSSEWDSETPTSGEHMRCRVYITSVSDSDREVGMWLYNLTEGSAYGYVLDATDLNNANTWYLLEFDAYDYLQDGITNNPDWDSGDDYGFALRATDVGNFYFDDIEMGTPSAAPSVSGDASAYVTSANLPGYDNDFSGTPRRNAYKWDIHSEPSGPGATITSGGTSRTVTIDFDSYGGYQIGLKVKRYSTSMWSSKVLKSHTVYPSY
jgi:hypothetical protein